ncbi:MAG: DUF1223 domain-containing protein [Rhodoferax sp.]|nr:DUF1223 domain-containing protein [Pseudorhodobacter sp.]
MRQFATALCGLMICMTAPVLAQGTSGVVVELYTSQGCSSCPPADAYLAELAQESGVIALALHVDYWDYIGWTDKFANPRYTDRQKGYARVVGSNTIYTPQMIVAGTDRVEGSDPDKVEGDIRRHQMTQSQVGLQLMRVGDVLMIRAIAKATLSGPVVVQLVRYHPSATVTIEHGENAGQTITYTNIVTSWTKLAEWPGKDDFELSVPVVGSDPAVVILQQPGPGLILAASVLK